MYNRLRIPLATYRLQYNRNFRFEDACSLVPYLSRLGISDVYASPILQARSGSTHGYDVTDPTRLNQELGPETDFDALVDALQQRGMGLLLDIVPNHMAASPENPWWRDVTEKGQDSLFAFYFDINWLDYEGMKDKVMSYRRFFDIGDLVGIRVENPQVFEATHCYILNLINEGKITGLRIDHIDGLYDPLEYLQRLQQRISPPSKSPRFYLVVEDILSGDETIPEKWPVFGTTGYDFTRTLNTLFVNSNGLKSLNHTYTWITGLSESFHDLVYEKKKQAMRELFPGEIDGLGQYLARLSGNPDTDKAGQALVELTACLPVYRTYTRSPEVSADDRNYIESAAKEASERNAAADIELSFLKRLLTLDFPPNLNRKKKNEWLNFVLRWQQLTGAVMAKGFEDTTLYNYNRLVSLNEVGGSPDTAGLSVEDFQNWNLTRMKKWPHTLNTTSTHDTKRSEDVRARINVLTELPEEWEKHLVRWQKLNREKRLTRDGLTSPEPNTEILLYQTLIGAWPLDRSEVPGFKERLKVYMIKAVREAKTITNWIAINQEYEDALLGFMESILKDSTDNIFLRDFLQFQKKIAFYGALNSLSQVLLKVTSPGVPDFYQGTELWDFSLVDPDNRRPVDFKKREMLLDDLIQKEANGEPLPIGDMLASWQDGRIKLYVTYRALNTRKRYVRLFQKGDYVPLRVEGKRRGHVCAFARSYGNQWCVMAVPRFFTKLSGEGEFPLGKQAWRDDCILLPRGTPQKWLNAFTGEIIRASDTGGAILSAEIFRSLPVALLTPCS